MITDLAEISRLAHTHETEDLQFRRRLHDRHVSDQGLREIARRLLGEFDCGSCANCCRQTRVEADAAEIEAIAEYLEMETAEVRRLYTESGSTSAETLIRHEDGQCVFLHLNSCMVYPARPRACRNFPSIAGESVSLGSRLASVCRQAAFCPVVYNALEEFKAQTGFRRH